jgi:hypothetical protein
MYKIQVQARNGGAEVETITTTGFRAAKKIGLLMSSVDLAVKVTQCDDETGEPIKEMNIWLDW